MTKSDDSLSIVPDDPIYSHQESMPIDASERTAEGLSTAMRLGVKVNVDGKALPQDATVDQIVEALKASMARDSERSQQ